MSIYPEIITGYGATLQAVEGMAGVHVREPGVHHIPIEMIASEPPAYSLLLVVLREGVNVCRHGRYSDLEDTTMVEWPVPTTAEDFPDRLREALVPVVQAELETATAQKTAAIAENGPDGIEIRDAIRRIG